MRRELHSGDDMSKATEKAVADREKRTGKLNEKIEKAAKKADAEESKRA